MQTESTAAAGSAAAAAAGHASLPHCLWHRICLLVYGDATRPDAVLRVRAALMLISRAAAVATRDVPLQLDLRGAGADLGAVKALLSAAPVRRLWLGAEMRGDEILRDPAVRAQSWRCLRELSASVSCTNTLQAFCNLQLLHLEAHVLPKLYPAVLWGLAGLQRLTLHHYEDFCLTDIPAALVPTIKELEVTPKPVALHSHFALRMPAAMALRSLSVHGSFRSILSHKAAPRATVDVAAMCMQCQDVVIEAEDVIFELTRALAPAGARAGMPAGGSAGAEGWALSFLEALLLHTPGSHRGGPWQRLEFRVLGGVALVPPQAGRPAAHSPWAAGEPLLLASPEEFAADLQHALEGFEGGALEVSVRREECSIFTPAVLCIQRAWRRAAGGTAASSLLS